MKQSAIVSIGFLILSLVLIACTPEPTAPFVVAATPSVTITPTATFIESSTLPPTLPTLPTSIPETATPSPVPTAPVMDVPAGTLTRLLELPANGTNFQLSPDEQWLSYLSIPPPAPDTSPGPGSSPAVLHLMSIESGAIWDVTSDCTTFVCEFAWLSTEQLLWRENGNLYVADTDGANRYDLAAPEPIVEIFGVTPMDIVVLRGETHLWRLYLPDGQWDQIPVPQMGPAPVLDYVNQNDRLYFNEDGAEGAISFDMVNHEFPNGYGTVILHIPFEKGSAPTYIMPPTPLAYLGSDGPPILPPTPLANSSYWLINVALSVSEDGYAPAVHFLVDGTGTLVPLAEVLNLTDYRIFNTTLSPDRRWIKVVVAPQLPYPAPSEPAFPSLQNYIATTNDFANGHLFTGEVLGWQSTPPLAFLFEYANQNAFLHRVALDTGETNLLLRMNAPYTLSEINTSSTIIFILEKTLPPRLYAYQANGTLSASIELPTHSTNVVDYYYYLSSGEAHAYFIATDPTIFDDEKPWLWQWDVTP